MNEYKFSADHPINSTGRYNTHGLAQLSMDYDGSVGRYSHGLHRISGISLAFGHSRLLMKNSVVVKVELKMTSG
jgi:hypothetical protein